MLQPCPIFRAGPATIRIEKLFVGILPGQVTLPAPDKEGLGAGRLLAQLFRGVT